MITNAITILSVYVSLLCTVGRPTVNCQKDSSGLEVPPIACPTNNHYPTGNLTASEIITKSPFITHSLVQQSVLTNNLAAQCFTYIELVYGIYLFFSSNTLKDGTTAVNVYFLMDGPQGPGTYWLVGAKAFVPSIYVGYALKQPAENYCPESCSSTVSAINFNVVTSCVNNDVFDPVLVLSTNTKSSECCLSSAQKYLKSYIGAVAFLNISNYGPIRCVGDLYGIPVINLDSMLSNKDFETISYPSLRPHKS